MGDSVSKFFLDNSFLEEPKVVKIELDKSEVSKDVVNIIDLFRLLSSAEKLAVKRLIREEDIF
jgi:hypothetical protein